MTGENSDGASRWGASGAERPFRKGLGERAQRICESFASKQEKFFLVGDNLSHRPTAVPIQLICGCWRCRRLSIGGYYLR